MSHTVLLVDDEPNVLEGLTRALHKEPYDIVTANSAEEAAKQMEDHPADLIVCDEEMSGMSGMDFLASVARQYPDTVRIVLTGHPTLPAALRAINEGRVYQFFTKPYNKIDFAITIRRALEQKDLLAKSRDLLEITKRQSALIDEARLVRRLCSTGRRNRAETVTIEGTPADTRELLEEMEGAVRNGRELLRDLRSVNYT